MRSSLTYLAISFLLLTIFAVTSWTACLHKSATNDEPLHLVAAWLQTHQGEFRCASANPPLWKYYVAAGTRADRLVFNHDELARARREGFVSPVNFCSDVLYRTPGNDADSFLFPARARMLVLAVLLGGAIGFWAWRLGGPLAAILALAVFCFDPNFIAHGPLVKNDVVTALIFLCLMLVLWLTGQRVTAARAIGLGLLLGAAMTTKFSGLLAVPLLLLGLLFRAALPAPWPVFRTIARTRFHRFFLAACLGFISLAISFAMIWACYQFRFPLGPGPRDVSDLGEVIADCAINQIYHDRNLTSSPSADEVSEWVNHWHPPLVVRSACWLNNQGLIPQPYTDGFLFTYATTLWRQSFLCGEIRLTGWWYYFPLAMLFKTPLATLIALLLAATAALFSPKRSDPWTIFSVAIAPIFYMAMSLRSDYDVGLRHIFPVYPFLFIFIGVIGARAVRGHSRFALWIIPILFAGLVTETFHAYPDFISFFNVAAGGPNGGIKLLGDSNLDWGQDLPDLAEWQKAHPRTQLYLCYLGTADPRYEGIHYINLDGSSAPKDQIVPTDGPKVFAFSASAIQGLYLTRSQRQIYWQFVRNKQPIAVLGGSIYLFDGS